MKQSGGKQYGQNGMCVWAVIGGRFLRRHCLRVLARNPFGLLGMCMQRKIMRIVKELYANAAIMR